MLLTSLEGILSLKNKHSQTFSSCSEAMPYLPIMDSSESFDDGNFSSHDLPSVLLGVTDRGGVFPPAEHGKNI